MIILEENFKWHLEAFASELFIYIYIKHFFHYKKPFVEWKDHMGVKGSS